MDSKKKSSVVAIFLGFLILILGIYSGMLKINSYIGYLAIFIGPLITIKGLKNYYRKYPKNINKVAKFSWTVLTIISFLILTFGFYLQTKISGGCVWGGPQTNPYCNFGFWLAGIPAIGILMYLIALFRIIVDKNA